MNSDFEISASRTTDFYAEQSGFLEKLPYLAAGAIFVSIALTAVYCASGHRLAPGISWITNATPPIDVTTKLGMGPIPASAYSEVVARQIAKLAAEPCDYDAVSALGNDLVNSDEKRLAARTYVAFADRCNANQFAERQAASIYFNLSDFTLARKYYGDLVMRFPQNDLDWYHKGQSEAALGLANEALDSYANAIALTRDQTNLGEWVFQEMSDVYASKGRFCEAMTPINTYISLSPEDRDNPRTRQLLATYAQRGGCRSYASGADTFPVTSSNVIIVRATVDGVAGTFAIDTGASFVSVTSAFADRAHLSGRETIRTSTANGDAEARLTKATEVRLGRLKASEVPVVIVSKPMGNIDGLLGRSFLARYDMTITHNRIVLRSRAL